MPCYNPMTELNPNEIQTETLKAELNNITDLLCAALSVMQTNEKYDTLPDKVKTWHENHKSFDLRRIQEQIEASMNVYHSNAKTIQSLQEKNQDILKEIEELKLELK